MHQDAEVPVVRLRRPSDMGVITTLDLKTHQYPMPMSEWQERVDKHDTRIVLVEVYHKPVGFCMWSTNEEENLAWILRIGVLPGDLRRKGLGSLLVEAVVRHSMGVKDDEGYPLINRIQIVVPSTNCRDDEDNVTKFLAYNKFYATGEILENYRKMYGDYVDGYFFERQLNVTPDCISKILGLCQGESVRDNFLSLFEAVQNDAEQQFLPHSTLAYPFYDEDSDLKPGDWVAELHFVVRQVEAVDGPDPDDDTEEGREEGPA